MVKNTARDRQIERKRKRQTKNKRKRSFKVDRGSLPVFRLRLAGCEDGAERNQLPTTRDSIR